MPPTGETLGAALLVRGRQGVTPTQAGMLRLGLRAASFLVAVELQLLLSVRLKVWMTL